MRSMFSDPAKPFYTQADLVPIGPFDPAAGDVVVDDGRMRIVDPVLADWIRRRFPR